MRVAVILSRDPRHLNLHLKDDYITSNIRDSVRSHPDMTAKNGILRAPKPISVDQREIGEKRKLAAGAAGEPMGSPDACPARSVDSSRKNTFKLFRGSRWILKRMKRCDDFGTQLHEFPERVRWTIRFSSTRGATFAEFGRGGQVPVLFTRLRSIQGHGGSVAIMME
ncbi:hypothetical protein VTN00DRAFT_4800 [Thermoascus crustaceus]|uniref:uncharacterized protein n=1 Tax=Thermoascus crustaceus TaxID=5088 RepID=UPI00374437DF